MRLKDTPKISAISERVTVLPPKEHFIEIEEFTICCFWFAHLQLEGS